MRRIASREADVKYSPAMAGLPTRDPSAVPTTGEGASSGAPGRREGAARAPQQARSRRTRQKLIDAAIECFERHGFDETTTAMIAAEAGVAVGTVYNYFDDKREMILELLETTDREIGDEVVAQLDPASWRGTTDPRERTRTLIDAIFHSQRLRPGIQRILWAQYFKDEDFRAPFEAMRARIRTAIDEFIEAVDESGLIRPDLDREMAAFVVLNAVQWNATQAYLSAGDAAFTDHAAAATAELVARYLFVEVDPAEGREPGA